MRHRPIDLRICIKIVVESEFEVEQVQFVRPENLGKKSHIELISWSVRIVWLKQREQTAVHRNKAPTRPTNAPHASEDGRSTNQAGRNQPRAANIRSLQGEQERGCIGNIRLYRVI